MIKTVQHYLAGALQNIRSVSRVVMQGMASDIEDIDRFFVNFVDAETVRVCFQAKPCARIVALCIIACC